jgi:hypothetical protein
MKLFFALFVMLGSFETAQAMQRTTTRMATPQVTKATQKYIPKLSTETLKNYSRKTGEKIYKTYSDIFYHPLYTHWFEPLYVGNKAEVWGHQFAYLYKNPSGPYTNFTDKRAHKQFHKTIYQKWKDQLTPEEQFQHQDAIEGYENAYQHYLLNPYDQDCKKELLHQTQRIYQRLNDYPASISIETSEPIFEH